MNYEQLFVGGISVILGTLSLAAGASNHDVFFQLKKVKWIETLAGRLLARAIYALIGVALIGLGIAIAMGFAPNSSGMSN